MSSSKSSSRSKKPNMPRASVIYIAPGRAPVVATYRCSNPANFLGQLAAFWPRHNLNKFHPVSHKTASGTIMTMHQSVLNHYPESNVVNHLATYLVQNNKAIFEDILNEWRNAPDPQPIKKTVDGVVTERIPNRPKEPAFVEPTVNTIYGPCFLLNKRKKCFRNVPDNIIKLVERVYRERFSYIRSGLRNEDEPQRHTTARHLFMKDYFARVKQQNEEDVKNGGQPVKGPILSGKPSAAWKAMTAEEKRPYEEAANAAKLQYERDCEAYYSQQPRIPKPPSKAHYLYANANPDGPTWGSLTDTDKHPWRAQEAQEQTAYQAELASLKTWCDERGQDFESLVYGFPLPAQPVEKTRKRREPCKSDEGSSEPAEERSTEKSTDKKVRKPRAPSEKKRSTSKGPKLVITKNPKEPKEKSNRRPRQPKAQKAPKEQMEQREQREKAPRKKRRVVAVEDGMSDD
jgi:hypothetical protein